MREILFRGKRIGSEEWVEGFYLSSPEFDNQEIAVITVDKPRMPYYVSKETIGQYTGLTDKNGTKIFEGDIVKVDYIGVNKGVSGVAEVVFNDCKFALVWGWHKEIVCLTDFANVCFEIIGNIHDNPELLESEVRGE